MATLEVPLGAPTSNTSTGVLWDSAGSYGDLADFLAPGQTATTALLRQFRVRESSGARINLRVSETTGQSGSTAGPQLSDAWEGSPRAVTVQVDGLADLVIAGPTHATTTTQDPEEPYDWRPVVAVNQWIGGFARLTAAQRASATLLIDDDVVITRTGEADPLDMTFALAEATGSVPATRMGSGQALDMGFALAEADGTNPLALSDFDQTGRAVDLLALIQANFVGDHWYRHSRSGGSDTPEAGDLGFGPGDTFIDRIRWRAVNRFTLYDNNVPDAIALNEYFGAVGTASVRTVSVQTTEGVASSNLVFSSAADNWVNLDFTADAAVMNAVSDGDLFLLAFWVHERTGDAEDLDLTITLGQATGLAVPVGPTERTGRGEDLEFAFTLGEADGHATTFGDADPLALSIALSEATGQAIAATVRTGRGQDLEFAFTLGEASGTTEAATERMGRGDSLDLTITLGEATGIPTRFGDADPLELAFALSEATGSKFTPTERTGDADDLAFAFTLGGAVGEAFISETPSLQNALGRIYPLDGDLVVRGFERETEVRTIRTQAGVEVTRFLSLRPSRGELAGILEGDTRAEALEQYDALVGFLRHAPVRFRHLPRPSRFLKVHIDGYSDAETEIGYRLAIRIGLVAPDPRWYDPESSQTETRPGASWDFTITNDGTLRVPLRFELSDATIDGDTPATIKNRATGQQLTFTGDLAADETLVVDGSYQSVEIRSDTGEISDHVADADGDFLIAGLHLDPGDNALEVRDVSGSGAQLVLKWDAAYNA